MPIVAPQLDEDLSGYPEGGQAPVVAPPSVAGPAVVPPGRLGNQYSSEQASDAEIGVAVGQLNAGQPVTALPRQEWSPAQAQSFAVRLDQFDQQAKAARIASDQAAMDAKMLDQMSRVAKSAKDIEIQRRTIDMMALQSALGKATTPQEERAALMRFGPNALGGGFAGALKATAPTVQMATPHEEDLGGGVKGVRISPQHFEITQRPTTPKEGTLTPVQTQRLREIDRQAHDIRVNLPARETSDEYINAQKQLNLLTLKRNKILSEAEGAKPKVVVAPPAAVVAPPTVAAPAGVTGTIHPMPNTKSGLVEGNIYDTPRGAAQWDGTHFKLVEKR